MLGRQRRHGHGLRGRRGCSCSRGSRYGLEMWQTRASVARRRRGGSGCECVHGAAGGRQREQTGWRKGKATAVRVDGSSETQRRLSLRDRQVAQPLFSSLSVACWSRKGTSERSQEKRNGSKQRLRNRRLCVAVKQLLRRFSAAPFVRASRSIPRVFSFALHHVRRSSERRGSPHHPCVAEQRDAGESQWHR